jgi:hypothetical protein
MEAGAGTSLQNARSPYISFHSSGFHSTVILMQPWVEFTFYLPNSLLTPQAKAYLRAADELRSRFLTLGASFVPSENDLVSTVSRYAMSADGPVVARTEVVFTIRVAGSLEDQGLVARLKATRQLVEDIYKEAGAANEEILCMVRQVYELPR